MSIFRLMLSRRWWWTTLIVLGGIALTIRLGIWQVARYHENKAIVDQLAAMQSASPLSLNNDAGETDLTKYEYRPVEAVGIFDFEHQIAIRNQIWVQSWGNDIGYKLVTPLKLADGSAVLVERGWIPLADNTPASWRKYDLAGDVMVKGIIRLPTKREFGGEIAPTLAPGETVASFWNLIDIKKLQQQIPYALQPIYIQQAPDAAFTGMPYRALSQPDSIAPSTNVGYAFTWFSFAALLFGGYPLYLRKQDKDSTVHQQ